MSILNKNSVIHLSTEADLDNYSYNQVYAGADGSIDINGTTVSMVGGSTINIRVNSLSGSANIYVMGNHISTLTGSPNLGSISV